MGVWRDYGVEVDSVVEVAGSILSGGEAAGIRLVGELGEDLFYREGLVIFQVMFVE